MSQSIKPKIGRPPMPYREEAANELCTRILEGENILAICADDHMPSWNTLARWRSENSAFASMYARAREASAEMLEAQVLEESASATAENWQIKRELANNLKWAAAKRHPRVYGDKIEATVTIHNGLADRLNAAMTRTRIIDVEPDALPAPDTEGTD